jgi:hypothetical protein
VQVDTLPIESDELQAVPDRDRPERLTVVIDLDRPRPGTGSGTDCDPGTERGLPAEPVGVESDCG